MKLLIATTNRKKIEELSALLKPLQAIEIVTPADLDQYLIEVYEDGDTFVANAVKKAQAWCQQTGLVTLSDDSGLVVPSLGGAPGVHSKRYSGPDATDAQNNAKLMAALEDFTPLQRTAHFVAVLALALPQQGIEDSLLISSLVRLSDASHKSAQPAAAQTFGTDACRTEMHRPVVHCFEGLLQGTIAPSATGAHGFGYDPIFVPEGYSDSMASLGPDVKNRISHRARALQHLLVHLQKGIEVVQGANIASTPG